MARQQLRHDASEPADAIDRSLQGVTRGPEVGLWLDSREAMVYTKRPSLKAWYAWRDRHGLVPCSDGTVSRRDLDRALATRRKPHRMAAASLLNLRKRSR
jgi:hypothetical protein